MLDYSKFRDAIMAAALIGGVSAFAGCSSSDAGAPAQSQEAPVVDPMTPLPGGTTTHSPTAQPSKGTETPNVPPTTPGTDPTGTANHLALVYRGPVVGCAGCSESIAAILQNSKWKLDVKYVGPGETLKLTA